MSRWIPTTQTIYELIHMQHNNQLEVYSTFTNMEPSHLSSEPQVITDWMLEGADFPLVRYKRTWEHGRQRETEKEEFFIYAASAPE